MEPVDWEVLEPVEYLVSRIHHQFFWSQGQRQQLSLRDYQMRTLSALVGVSQVPFGLLPILVCPEVSGLTYALLEGVSPEISASNLLLHGHAPNQIAFPQLICQGCSNTTPIVTDVN